MNITEELNQIIVKYQLDRYYPRFQMKLQAQRIVEEIIQATDEKAQILLVGTGKEAVDCTRALIGKYRQTECFIISDMLYDQDIWNKFKQADKVLFVSFHNAVRTIELLENHHITFENLYDIFLCRGLIFEDEYYRIVPSNYNDYKLPDMHERTMCDRGVLQLNFYTIKRKYEKSKNVVLKNILLEKMLFLTLYLKNFVEAERCVKEIQHNGSNESVDAAWAEIKDLLERIKDKLLQRKQKDVVWFWMDAVSFDDSKEMTYLRKMKEKSLSFSNAFTNMPYTNPTLRAVFCQKRCVSDQSYKIEKINSNSSEMLSYLKGNGYHVKVISQYFYQTFDEERGQEFYESASISFWSILQYMLLDDEKLFILAHALEETHAPWISIKTTTLDNRDEMAHYGRQDLDEQMEFYGSFFNKDVMQIFMSDHGWQSGDFLKSHHIHMDIYHSDIKPQKIDEMFSLLDFYPLIRQLMEEKKIDTEVFRREYVPIENLDRYNAVDVTNMFINKTIDLIRSFGYMGVISKNEIYVRFSIGNEYQHSRKDSNWRPLLVVEREIENDNNLEVLRQEAGIYPLEILKEEKFTYSGYLHKLYRIYRIRRKELIQSLNTYIMKILSDYEDGSVAIRTGGIHSYYLYAVLEENVQKKIGFFIDYNSQCLCAACGKKIISRDSLVEESIKAVILSSYIYRDKLKDEASQYPTHMSVIDIYDVFEQIGYFFRNEFYGTMGLQEEDYDKVYKP